MIGKRFYFMRHGETIHNNSGKMAGSTDSPLTEKGRDQARATQIKIKDLQISKIYHSPLIRAHETAILANEEKQAVLHAHDDLKEWNMGDWEGESFDTVLSKIRSGEDPANGEMKEAFYDRAHKIVHNLLTTENEPFLIVAHGGLFHAWIKRFEIQTDLYDIHNCMLIDIHNDNGLWCAFEIAEG